MLLFVSQEGELNVQMCCSVNVYIYAADKMCNTPVTALKIPILFVLTLFLTPYSSLKLLLQKPI